MDPLDAYPARADVPWDEVDGRVVLALPKPHGPVERLVNRIVPVADERHVSLEGASARVWLLADGTRTLRELAREAFRDAPAERMEERAVRFAQDLAARGWLRLQDAPARAADAQRGLTPEKGYRAARCRRCKTEHRLRLPQGARYFCPRCRRPNLVP